MAGNDEMKGIQQEEDKNRIYAEDFMLSPFDDKPEKRKSFDYEQQLNGESMSSTALSEMLISMQVCMFLIFIFFLIISILPSFFLFL
jgi:hypothetical protein